MRRTPIQVYAFFCLVVSVLAGCGPSKRGLFGKKKSPHEQYGDKIRSAGLDKTIMGARWFAAAQASLASPVDITVPFREAGYFAANDPSAAGYSFNGQRGAEIRVSVAVTPVPGSVFVELYQPKANEAPEFLIAADSTHTLKYELDEDGPYIIRLQPELLLDIEYTITVSTAPSLAFPVHESGRPKLISFWQDPRDLGARKHEGVDIKADFRAPAIAAADGRVHRVTTNRLGGKVVFMSPEGKEYALYYAHLDSQTVNSGQTVKKGDTLGLVGNTGNAKGTVPHLHFGIYARGGAVDPLPFVDPREKRPPEIKAETPTRELWKRLSADTELLSGPFAKSTPIQKLPRATPLKVQAASAEYLKVSLPDGRTGFIKSASTTTARLVTHKADSATRLLTRPDSTAAAVAVLTAPTIFDVRGIFAGYMLVDYKGRFVWIRAQKDPRSSARAAVKISEQDLQKISAAIVSRQSSTHRNIRGR